MKKILVPTDFSTCARAAEDAAIALAKLSDAEIHFLHIMLTPVDWVKISLEREKLFPETKKQIVKVKNELSLLVNRCKKLDIKAKQFLVFNTGREEIEKHLLHFNHDFLVMGTYGANGVKKFIGSNTQKVLQHSNVPVLSLKHNLNFKSLKNLVIASDFEKETQKSFKKIFEFTELIKSKKNLLYVNTPFHFQENDVIEQKIQNFIKVNQLHNYTVNIYNSINTELGITKFCISRDVDIIAVVSHGKRGIMKLISPSLTEKLINHSEIPVLSVNINPK